MIIRRMSLRETLGAAFAVGVLVTLAACAGRPGPDERGGSGGRHDRMGTMAQPIIYSPNGEPLSGGALGAPSCRPALEYWLDRADADHDGRLSREEFLADARAQFVRMDLDGQGSLTADALERYREPYRGQGRSTASSGIDPVMSADVNFDGKVTRDEFMKQAAETFAHLDADRDGALIKAELEVPCTHMQQAAARRHVSPPNGGGQGGPGGPSGGRRGGGGPF